MNLIQWFEKGLTLEQYLESMKVNRDGMERIIQQFSLTAEDKERLTPLKEKRLRVIVLTEDWCGDALLNNPILVNIAEEAKIDVRFVLRDENLELMDQYLTNGTSRSIPIFIFIDEAGKEYAVWGPRAPKIQTMVDEAQNKLPDKDDPRFNDEQKALFKKLATAYQEQTDLWHIVAEDIIETLSTMK